MPKYEREVAVRNWGEIYPFQSPSRPQRISKVLGTVQFLRQYGDRRLNLFDRCISVTMKPP
jgi:hypothetical protein